MTVRFFIFFISLLIFGCAGYPGNSGISVRSIIIDQENPQVDLKPEDDLTVHFNKQIPIGSTMTQRLEMFFIESEGEDIRGTITDALVGECIDPDEGYFCVNKAVVGRVVEINLKDIERINVWKARPRVITYSQQGVGSNSGSITNDLRAMEIIVITICLLTLGDGCK